MSNRKIFLVIILILSIFFLSLFLLGFRTNILDLNREMNASSGFESEVIVASRVYQDQEILVSQSGNMISCRGYSNYFGFLWHFEGKSMKPINLSEYTKNESFDSVIDRYISQCSLPIINPILKTSQDIKMDQMLSRINYVNRYTDYQFAEMSRSTVLDYVSTSSQVLKKGDVTLLIIYNDNESIQKIEVTRISQDSDNNISNLFYGLRSIVYGNLDGVDFSKEIISQFKENIMTKANWVLEDGDLRIECIVPFEQYVISILH